MAVARRIYVSMPADVWLAPNQNDFKWALVEEIEKLGYIPEIFTDPTGRQSLAAGRAWSASEADKIARRCIGAVIIGLPRWEFKTAEDNIKLPTEYCHYEGAVAYTLGLPMLVIVEDDVLRRVVFDPSFKGYVGVFPSSVDRTWLTAKEFQTPFNYWKKELAERRDVFLGYCSSSAGTASNIKRFLQADLGLTVLDWQTDFLPARFILNQIEKADARCSAGIFLFTNDDKMIDDKDVEKAVPRDNVVFEAGYFINSKGKDNVLIVRQTGTKMPADLGGDIYLTLADKSNIQPLEDQLRRFVAGWST